MNRYLYIAFAFGIIINGSVQAQNLIPNSGFELVSTCNPASQSDAMQNVISDWYTYDYSTNSPDIFNECFTFPVIHLPNSTFGFTFANSGTGIAGVGSIPAQNDHREVISNTLTTALVQDSAYCVTFFVKNARSDDDIFYSENLGLVFSSGQMDHTTVRQQNAEITPGAAVQGSEWVEVSGYYIASGGEQYIHIGYFGQNHSYYIEPDGSGLIYYFIDDVSVIPCNKDSLLSVVLDLPNAITPNGDFINDLYQIKHHNITTMQVQVLNRWGNLVAEYDGLTTVWNGTDQSGNPLSEGVYFVRVAAETTFGETLHKQQFVQLYLYP